MKGIVAAAALLMSGFLAPAFAYDDFNGPVLDMDRWHVPVDRFPHEIVREVRDEGGSRFLFLEDRYTGGFGANNARGNVILADPHAVEAISVPVFIEDIDAQGAASTRFRVFMEHLRFMDDDPGGKLWVTVDIEKRSGQGLRARYFIERCEDDACSEVHIVFQNTDFAPVSVNTWHTLGVSWSSDSITIAVDDVIETLHTPDGVTIATAPIEQSWILFGSRFRGMFNPADIGYLRARVGVVKVNGVDYDDYAIDGLNPAKWLNPERLVRWVSDGELEIGLAATSNTPAWWFRTNQVVVRNPVGISSIAADLRVEDGYGSGNFQPRARVGGNWYTNGGPVEGFINDVFAESAIYHDGFGVKGQVIVWHCSNADCSNGVAWYQDDDIGPLELETTYRTSVSWTGSEFVFNIGPYQRSFTPEAHQLPDGPASVPSGLLGVRIIGDAGEGGILAAFDNVTINFKPRPRSRGGLPVWLLGTLGD